MMPPEVGPKAPAGLRRAGRAAWRALVVDWEFAGHEQIMLRQLCGLLDQEAALVAATATSPAITTGSTGQRAVDPALPELRQLRLAIIRATQALGLDAAAQQRSSGGRGLARLRWSSKRGDVRHADAAATG